VNWLSVLANPVVIRVVLTLLVVATLYAIGHSNGADSVQRKWDAEKLASERASVGLKEVRDRATNKVVESYEVKMNELKKNATTIIKKVNVYVPQDSCPLPAGFRVLHDAAARNKLPDPSPSLNDSP